MLRLQVTADASGAAAAGIRGDVVVIVDVIDMSTTAEALWDEGILCIWGAATANSRSPVTVNPEKMGYMAGQSAMERGCGVIVISEPRVATMEERLKLCRPALEGLKKVGIEPEGVYANLGAETIKEFQAMGKVALLVTDTGGTAFDAAIQAGASAVTTATIARTRAKRGIEPARAGLSRAMDLAAKTGKGLTFVAASANSWEDVLAAEYLANMSLMGLPGGF